jgi:hypothetical protein
VGDQNKRTIVMGDFTEEDARGFLDSKLSSDIDDDAWEQVYQASTREFFLRLNQ